MDQLSSDLSVQLVGAVCTALMQAGVPNATTQACAVNDPRFTHNGRVEILLSTQGIGHSGDAGQRPKNNTALAWLAVAALLVFAAIGPLAAAAPPTRLDEACSKSTNSIQQLATIDHAGDTSFQCLGLSLDGDRITAIRLETHRFATTGPDGASEDVKTVEFSLAVLASSHGVVLDGIPGHDAILLQGHFSTPPDKAELVTSYLYNGFINEYRSCVITLDRTPNAGWRLVNRFGQTIAHIVVRTRQLPLLGMFGIANLEGACTQHDR